MRILQSEDAFNSIDERLVIGRRLTPREFDTAFTTVVDLTAEFFEPSKITAKVNYVSFPILDAATPSVEGLASLVKEIMRLEGKVYIHCAQGHGRTGLVTAAVLMARDKSLVPENALDIIRSMRPALHCNAQQMLFLGWWRDQNQFGDEQ